MLLAVTSFGCVSLGLSSSFLSWVVAPDIEGVCGSAGGMVVVVVVVGALGGSSDDTRGGVSAGAAASSVGGDRCGDEETTGVMDDAGDMLDVRGEIEDGWSGEGELSAHTSSAKLAYSSSVSLRLINASLATVRVCSGIRFAGASARVSRADSSGSILRSSSRTYHDSYE